jgi:hypothetical protein
MLLSCRHVSAVGLTVIVLGLVVPRPARSAAEPTPAYRLLPAPKVLYLAGSPNREQFAELLRHCVPASVDFAPLEYGDLEYHHLTDKPLEERPEETKEVARKGREHVEGLLARLDRFDLVIAQFPPRKELDIERRLAAWVRKGGRLIFINPSWETTFDGTPLAEIMPVKTGRHKAWTSDCPGATDHPLVRGLPLETLGMHWYGPVYEPADDRCQPLSESNRAGQDRAQNAQFWYRRLPGGGQVVHLFAAGDSKWQWHNGTNCAAYAADRPDDSAAWIALYQRLIYGLVYGDRAFPVLAKIGACPKTSEVSKTSGVCLPHQGEKLLLVIDLENRSDAQQRVKVRVELFHRRYGRRIIQERPLTLTRAQRTNISIEPTIDLPCTDSYIVAGVRSERGRPDAVGREQPVAPLCTPGSAGGSHRQAQLHARADDRGHGIGLGRGSAGRLCGNAAGRRSRRPGTAQGRRPFEH